jgi:hypothetical protein
MLAFVQNILKTQYINMCLSHIKKYFGGRRMSHESQSLMPPSRGTNGLGVTAGRVSLSLSLSLSLWM